ncbi:hypothetical protein C8R47DRAFT_213175 [Mycena vitilis]|nr:hypothetical protein C8R47DRAFT_213175 [Mycena vitilis]
MCVRAFLLLLFLPSFPASPAVGDVRIAAIPSVAGRGFCPSALRPSAVEQTAGANRGGRVSFTRTGTAVAGAASHGLCAFVARFAWRERGFPCSVSVFMWTFDARRSSVARRSPTWAGASLWRCVFSGRAVLPHTGYATAAMQGVASACQRHLATPAFFFSRQSGGRRVATVTSVCELVHPASGAGVCV